MYQLVQQHDVVQQQWTFMAKSMFTRLHTEKPIYTPCRYGSMQSATEDRKFLMPDLK